MKWSCLSEPEDCIIPTPRAGHTSTSISPTEFLVFGGQCDGTYFNDIYIYNCGKCSGLFFHEIIYIFLQHLVKKREKYLEANQP